MELRTKDILTTLALAVFGLIAYYLAEITGALPPEYAVAFVLAFGVISQLTSEQRVREATETVKRWIYFDRITTLLLVAWPIVLLFQDNILGAIPVAYVGAGSFILATVSQWVAEKRAEKADTPTPIMDDTIPIEEPQ